MKKLLALVALMLLCGCQSRVPVLEEIIIEESIQEIVEEQQEQTPPPQKPVNEDLMLEESVDEKKNTILSAYLPLNACSDTVIDSPLLTQLDKLTVNVGCYWKADSSLEVKDTLPFILEHLKETQPDLSISCTINPKNGAAAAIDSPEERKLLVENMLAFCEKYELAGVDIDWEFPQGNEWEDFNLLIIELSEALSQTNRSLSLAFYPENVNLSEEAIKAVHSVHVMAYDQFDEQGYHSTYESAEEAIVYFTGLGFQEEQLILGIPAYGRPLSGAAQWPLYCDYAPQLADGTDLLGENYFNSPQTAARKAAFAHEKGLQGVFLYHLGCDSHDEWSLTRAIREVLDEL